MEEPTIITFTNMSAGERRGRNSRKSETHLPLRPLKKLLSKHYILNVEDLLVHTYALCRLLLNRGAIALFAIKAFAA